jgi:acyl-CoA synthetase (AMP-forming)/AMP-acid ligase II
MEPRKGACQNIYDLIMYRAEVQPFEDAFIYLDNNNEVACRLTFSELKDRCEAVCYGLIDRDLSGKYVVVLCDNDADYLVSFLGSLIAAAVPVTVNPLHKDLESFLTNIKNTLGGITILSSEKYILKNRELLESVADNTYRIEELVHKEKQLTDIPLPSVQKTDLAFLQFSSGSTSIPKGIMITHGNILDNSRQIQIKYEHTRETVGMSWMPNYHDLGLIGGIFQPLYGGFKIYIMSHMAFISRPLRWLEAIGKYSVNTTGGPNFAYELCVQRYTPKYQGSFDLSSWDIAFVGADRIFMETLDRFTGLFTKHGFSKRAFFPAYGLAETVLFATAISKKDLPKSKGQVEGVEGEYVSCGKPVDSVVVIVDPRTKEPLKHDQVGEIWLKGESIAKGYIQQEKDNSSFGCRLNNSLDSDEYLNTGDLGFLDEYGDLYVTGRSKEIIIINGQNYYPQDIEMAAQRVASSYMGIRTAAFEKDGEIILLLELKRRFVRQSEELHYLPEKIGTEIYKSCGINVDSVMLLAPNSIPVTSSGKTKRLACKKSYPHGFNGLINTHELSHGEIK